VRSGLATRCARSVRSKAWLRCGVGTGVPWQQGFAFRLTLLAESLDLVPGPLSELSLDYAAHKNQH